MRQMSDKHSGVICVLLLLAAGPGCFLPDGTSMLGEKKAGGTDQAGDGAGGSGSEVTDPEFASAVWKFDQAGALTFDGTKIAVTDGLARLFYADQTDDDNSSGGFGGGTHSSTAWNSGGASLELSDPSTSSTGTFVSRVMDAGASLPWDTFAWVPNRPYGKALPDAAAKETAYPAGNVDMTSNILLLHMEEAAWTGANFEAVDASGIGNHGTAFGGATTSAAGRFGRAADFEGSTAYLFLDNPANKKNAYFDNPVSVRTGAFWYYARATTLSQVIYEEGDASDGLNIYIRAGNVYVGAWSNTNLWAGQFLSTATSAGQWHHVAYVFDSVTDASFKLYHDGVLISSQPVPVGIATHNGDDAIGAMQVASRFDTGGDTAASGHFLNGLIDEAAIWDRALSSAEINDLYRRGVLRLKLQVRSCDDTACSGESWIGPSGDSTTYFTEDDSSAAGLPSVDLTAIPVADNRYFQYQAVLESEDVSLTPSVASVEAGPLRAGGYPTDSPTVEPTSGVRFSSFSLLSTFAVIYGAENQGSATFQLSDDGTSWYYFDGSAWVAASGVAQSNTASDVNAAIDSFPPSGQAGTFYFRMFLSSDGSQKVEVDEVRLDLFLQ